MFRKKESIRESEEYRLVESVEKARKDWIEVEGWRMMETDLTNSYIQKMLAELRYRYLLRQARKRESINRWYYDTVFQPD